MSTYGLLLLSALSAQPAPSPTPPVFRADVDVVAVDVNVVGRDGRPVRDLRPEDFVLTLDGRPRRVLSADYMALGADAERPAAQAAPAPAAFSTNEGAPTGRLVVLVVDTGNIRIGGGRPALHAADRLLDQLTPDDRVALVTLPGRGGPQVDLTADHALVRAALGRVVGRSRAAGRRLTVTEALAFQDAGEEWEAAQTRECPPGVLSGNELLICRADLENEATTVALAARQSARESYNGLRALFEALRRIDGPKSVVLVTEGMLFESGGEVRDLATTAGAARVTLYVLRLDSPLTDASIGALHMAGTDDARMKAEGLDRLAALTRGTTFPVTGSTATVFERIGRELSGYYLLGFEPEEGDRDGATHEIGVQVRRPGVTVRARRAMSVPTAAPSAEVAKELLATALQSPFLVTELPVRVATYALGAPAGKVTLVIAADLGPPGAPAAGMTVGWALLAGGGRVVSSAIQRAAEAGARAAAGARGVPYLGSTVVEPGRYTLRLAAVDARGRRGSVEHAVAALLTTGAGVEATDLLLAPPSAVTGQSLQPSVVVDASAGLVAYAEVAAHDAGVLDAVTATVEAAAREDGPALLSSPALVGAAGDGRRPVQGTLATSVLPAGGYVARMVVSVRGTPALRVTRPFTLAAGSAAGTLSAADILPALPAFRAQDFTPEPVAAAFLATAPPAALPDMKRGLALLAAGDLPQANQAFRAAARAGRGALAAAFYVGVAFAAARNDREAVGAWQTARVAGLPVAAAYGALAEALLRLGDVEDAADAIREGLDRWPGDPRLTRALAVSHALAGRRGVARELLRALLDVDPADAGVRFLLVRLLLEDLRLTPSDDAARAALERHARAYVAEGGPHAALVAAWLESLSLPR